LPLFAFFFAYSLSHGEIQLSGIAAIAILVALARDWQVRRQIAVARRASGPAGGT
jgi:intracellular septation protein A